MRIWNRATWTILWKSHFIRKVWNSANPKKTLYLFLWESLFRIIRDLQKRIPRINWNSSYCKCSRIYNGCFWFILRRSQYSDNMASNRRWLVNVLKGFGTNELWPDRGTIPEFVCREWEKPWQVNIAGVPTEIRTEYLSNSRCYITQIFRWKRKRGTHVETI
jgi:hypothetical protein